MDLKLNSIFFSKVSYFMKKEFSPFQLSNFEHGNMSLCLGTPKKRVGCTFKLTQPQISSKALKKWCKTQIFLFKF